MIIDCHDWKTAEDREKYSRRVFVDGKEITGVWYVDTDLGLVKTYQFLQDADWNTLQYYASGRGKPSAAMFATVRFDKSRIPPEWEMEYPEDGAVSRTIRGKIELKPIESQCSGGFTSDAE